MPPLRQLSGWIEDVAVVGWLALYVVVAVSGKVLDGVNLVVVVVLFFVHVELVVVDFGSLVVVVQVMRVVVVQVMRVVLARPQLEIVGVVQVLVHVVVGLGPSFPQS
jgi:hypothetical protein